MSVYLVYDAATKQVLKRGVAASADDCEAQVQQGFGQAILVADTAEELDELKTASGLS